MGNCAASRLAGGGGGAGAGGDPVAVCRDRKRLIKAAADRRFALAAAHAGYAAALRAVADALDVFVARHTAPAPILITLPTPTASPPGSPKPAQALMPSAPSPTPSPPPPQPQPQRQTEAPPPEEEQEDCGARTPEMGTPEMGRPYYYTPPATPPPPPPAASVVGGWDFFNPFYGTEEVAAAAAAISDEEMRAVREREGIPDLEEAEEEDEDEDENENEGEGEKVAAAAAKNPKADSSLGVAKQEGAKEVGEVTTGNNGGGLEVGMVQPGRELLAALKEVEELLSRAAEAGKEVSGMLEAAARAPELKESPSKIIHAIAWHRSPSSVSSSSYRSELGASSNSLSWTEKSETNKSDIFDDYGGMKSGSHSQTLGRLYAWEKKLYEEVKAIDQIRQTYEKKCVQLRNQDAKGSELRCAEKTRTNVRDLYTRIWVSLRAAESISDRIQKLRDEELQPQLVELLHGFARTWKVMVESHEAQRQIMFEVNSFTCPAYGKFCNDAQRHATLRLEVELRNWRSCFVSYVSAQKAYIEALDGWLSKFIVTDTIRYSRGISSIAPDRAGAPPLVVICHEWHTTLSRFPYKRVPFTMRNFNRSVRVLWLKQGEEQQQKRKVDGLAKELDKKATAYKRAENKVIETKLLEHRPEQDARQRMEQLSERKEALSALRRRLEAEKARHHHCMRDTHDITLNGFKIGLASMFEALAEFSRDSVALYEDLLARAGPKEGPEKAASAAAIEQQQPPRPAAVEAT
ncbi:protein ALTERED PHOSPHATE STARVATION RESPONSE 1-like [Triticum dicoccoides]|uniref:protein ALTERED PHOSPHATE STARVATION RESPONSE 1-like n=1 Tax=Triticum dicoccoides TaxID=85692 RepID=UPI000E78ADDC|nr:protein ALTERED PHOSPHATE STARVATION RESPONSE 1-like [Triticum dicoccoides]